jgi:hypothetical protein
MSNLSDLKAALITAAASLTDTVDRLEVLSDIDEWYLCRTALSALTATDIQAYSIAGRSITRAQIPQLRDREGEIYERIKSRLYLRGIGYIDFRSPIDEGSVTP